MGIKGLVINVGLWVIKQMHVWANVYGVDNWEWENQAVAPVAENEKDCAAVDIGTIWRVCCVECEEEEEKIDDLVALQKGCAVWQQLMAEDEREEVRQQEEREDDISFQRGFDKEEQSEERRQQERYSALRDEYERLQEFRAEWDEAPVLESSEDEDFEMDPEEGLEGDVDEEKHFKDNLKKQ